MSTRPIPSASFNGKNGNSPAANQTSAADYGRSPRIPSQRWHIASPNLKLAQRLTQATDLSPLLTQVMINRGITTSTAAQIFLNPEIQQLPSPVDEFPDLSTALELLATAIEFKQKIAICGDYDADGMTSTSLLIRALRFLGATVDYAIPSRMKEGYGINQRIVEEFHQEGVDLILTVDNGIAAYDPVVRARELGLKVIITDHHDLPPRLPPAHAILNPKLIQTESPYYGLAGVGVAYVLAVCLAQYLGKTKDLATSLLELFTLGTIADLAPLTGVNRRWVKRGLKLLPVSRLAGVRSLIQVAGLSHETGTLKPEAIGFRLGPRINAVGRIHNPEIVIELLTTDDEGYALERAMECEQINQCRQQLCELIEQEAIHWIEDHQPNLAQERVLVVVNPGWHHGVIGIVASRLVERYGVPVFIGTYEDDDPARIRGSARGIPEFHVFEALQFCGDGLDKFGGHRAAGGFSLQAENLPELRSRLQIFANMQLQPHHLKPLVTVDVQANFDQLDLNLYSQIDALHPCGIENADPVFWTPNVRVLEQKPIGRSRNHLKLTLAQDGMKSIRAIAWRWGEYCPLPSRVDVAYRLRLNEWKGSKNVELEVIGVRLPQTPALSAIESPLLDEPMREHYPLSDENLPLFDDDQSDSQDEPDEVSSNTPSSPIYSSDRNTGQMFDVAEQSIPAAANAPSSRSDRELDSEGASLPPLKKATFTYNQRQYLCSLSQVGSAQELRIRNPEGQVLAVQPQHNRGLLGRNRAEARDVDVSHPHIFNLIQAALDALNHSS